VNGSKFVAGAAPLLGFIQTGMGFMSEEARWWWKHEGDKWPIISCSVWVAAMTALLGASLAVDASRKGQRAHWGWMALTGVVGVVVVYCLPDRTARPARGFPVEPTQP
jgi:hypothetical protein